MRKPVQLSILASILVGCFLHFASVGVAETTSNDEFKVKAHALSERIETISDMQLRDALSSLLTSTQAFVPPEQGKENKDQVLELCMKGRRVECLLNWHKKLYGHESAAQIRRLADEVYSLTLLKLSWIAARLNDATLHTDILKSYDRIKNKYAGSTRAK
jgi:hypothetical protein